MLTVVAVTRSKSLHCTTLTSILYLNMYAIQNNVQISVHYISDPQMLSKYMKSAERLIFFDYAVSINPECIHMMCRPFPKGYHMMVFPAVKEGIDWVAFKRKTLEGTPEPPSKRGLSFDTSLGKHIGDHFYEVNSTTARVWAMDTKKIKIKWGPDFFERLKVDGIKICACSAARCTVHYIHKCIANILETSGVSVSK